MVNKMQKLNRRLFICGIVFSLIFNFLYFLCLLNFKKNIIFLVAFLIILFAVVPIYLIITAKLPYKRNFEQGALIGTIPGVVLLLIKMIYSFIFGYSGYDIQLILYTSPPFLGIFCAVLLLKYLKSSDCFQAMPIILSGIYCFLITLPANIFILSESILRLPGFGWYGYLTSVFFAIILYPIFRHICFVRFYEKAFYASLVTFIVVYSVPSYVVIGSVGASWAA